MVTAPRKVALVTGTSSGIGRATALHLAKQGWRVFGVRVEEIAGVVSFLAGPDASYVTGTTLNIHRGFGA